MDKQNNLQKLNLQNLLTVSKILKNIEHFVCFGTLLGLIREQKIIHGDDDVDFFVDYKNKKKIIQKIKLNKSFKVNKKVSNKHFIQFTNKKNNLMSFIDFYFYSKFPENNYIIERQNWLGHINDANFALHIPNKLIFPIKRDKNFNSVFIPNKPEKVLNFLYGESWLSPLKKDIEYRVEIKNNKPFMVRRSFLGSLTRWFKSKMDSKKYKKII